MKICLLPDEKKELERQHKRERDRRICDRIKAVLLSDEGWSQIEIGQALRLHPDTIKDHLRDYRDQRKLKPTNGGSKSCLNEQQTAELAQHLDRETYTKVSDIQHHVRSVYGLEYSGAGMVKWLHRNGFSYKKPATVPKRVDPEKQRKFIDAYENLLNTAGDDPVLFVDSVHPTMATKVAHGWIKRGKRKLITATASRTRVNITGAIDLESMNVMAEMYDTVNADSVISFFKSIESKYSKAIEIHVILDQSGYHRSEKVRDYVASSKIKLHFLPPYSPNLNPIERLWKVMNEEVRNNCYFSSAKEFRGRLNYFFTERWPEIAWSMVDRITDNFQKIEQVSSG